MSQGGFTCKIEFKREGGGEVNKCELKWWIPHKKVCSTPSAPLKM